MGCTNWLILAHSLALDLRGHNTDIFIKNCGKVSSTPAACYLFGGQVNDFSLCKLLVLALQSLKDTE